MPLGAKLLAGVLIGCLFLIIWRKSRRYVSGTLLVVFSFSPLVFAGVQIIRAHLAKDLTVFSERFTEASGALLLSMLCLLIPIIGPLLKLGRPARGTPPSGNHGPTA